MNDKNQTQAQASAISSKSLGAATLVIKEVDVSQPTRSVTRMWPNR